MFDYHEPSKRTSKAVGRTLLPSADHGHDAPTTLAVTTNRFAMTEPLLVAAALANEHCGRAAAR